MNKLAALIYFNKLLKKNEELTLYILSLQNQIDEILKNK